MVAHLEWGWGKSPLRTEEKHQPLFGGKPIGTWTATEPTQRAGGEGSGSASPPNPVGTLVLHPGVGPGARLQSLVGRFGRALPHSGQRRLFPNWIPFLPPPIFCHHASELKHLSLHIPGSYAESGAGDATHAKPRLTAALGCLPRPPATAHQTPGPEYPHSPEEYRPLLGLPVLACPSSQCLGCNWGFGLCHWHRCLSTLAAQGEKSCPGHQRPPAASSRLGQEKASAVRGNREGREKPEARDP